MRRIFGICFAVLLAVVFACDGQKGQDDQNTAVPKGDPAFPPLTNSWVIDKVGVLSEAVIAAGDEICQRLQDDSVAEVVVVLINSVRHPDDWATHYGRWLGLGSKGFSTEGGNDGLVWLIRPDADEKLTVSVGRGLPKFTAADYGSIMDNSIEYFNFNNYDKGVMNLIVGTDAGLRKIYGRGKFKNE